MKQIIQFSLLTCLIILLVSCNRKEQTKISESNKIEVRLSKFASLYPDFDSATLKQLLQTEVENDSILFPFYTANEYTPIWMRDTLDTKGLKNLIQILDNVHEHGLSPDIFKTTIIASLTDSIDAGVFAGNSEILYKKIVDLEQLSTHAVIKYVKGMTYGFLDPKALYRKDDYSIQLFQPDSTFYADLYSNINRDPITSLINSHPTSDIYLKLQETYRNLESKKDIELTKIENKGVNLNYKIGDKGRNISAIANRLIVTGEYIPDPLSEDSLYEVLDERLLEAVNTFRLQNSYPKENEIGSMTITALNRPLEYYQKKIQANMERYRWKRVKAKRDKHIEVNIASFLLVASQPDSIPLIMNVCVGNPKSKTPTLESDISYINLNPTWNVPTSISKNEIAVLQKKDHTYIPRHNMRLFKNGKEVDATTIDWNNINPSKFSYTIRQESGNGNSLGRLKFMFSNPFSVYLHDTPSKNAFNYKNRAISHGCVRVQKPIDLAFFCTSPSTDLYKDQLYYSIDKQPLSKEGKKRLAEDKLRKIPDIITMKDKISLSIDYYTTYILPNDNTLYYADDIYEYDNIMTDAFAI